MALLAAGLSLGWPTSGFAAEPPCPAPVPSPNPAPPPDSALAPGAKEAPAPVGFGSNVISASDVIVVGVARLVGKVTIKGTTVARVEVERVLKGTAEKSLTVFVAGPQNTDDPRAPSAPYIDEKARRAVLFLRATPNGSGLALDTLFLAEDVEGREKLEVLEQELAIAARPDALERGRLSAAYFLGLLAGEKPWSRTHAIRELESLSRKAPAAFDDVTLARLETEKRSVPGRSERAVLSATLDRLDPDHARRNRGASAAPAPPTEAPSEPASDTSTDPTDTPRYRRVKVRFAAAADDEKRASALSELASIAHAAAANDLLDAFRTGTPFVRERAVILLADVGVDSAWPTLRATYETETDASIREAIVRAAGYLGPGSDVVWVSTHATGDALRRARCFAYARMRTSEALIALKAEGEAARSATPPDESVGALVDYLAGPAFEKSDPALKLRAQRAPASPSRPPK